MKNFDTRTYSINDFIEWNKNKQLELSPRFQRRSVWTDNARSYLMDTIVRGKPIPKVFIRQKLNATTKVSIREVVDGQQRLRTILSYLSDGFQINPKHNEQFGGKFFSQLDEVDPDIQSNILNYEISVDLLVNMPDEEVLDVFSRLNSYAVVLNDQERINADHFGPFKSLADKIGHRYFDFWVKNKILSEAAILRMAEVTLVADLLIAMSEGIKSKKQIRHYYDHFEENFNHDPVALDKYFDETMRAIADIFGNGLRSSEFRRIHIFYSLFTALYHLARGLPGLAASKEPMPVTNFARARAALEAIEGIFSKESTTLKPEERQFLEDSRRATTDAPVRVRRTAYIVDALSAK